VAQRTLGVRVAVLLRLLREALRSRLPPAPRCPARCASGERRTSGAKACEAAGTLRMAHRAARAFEDDAQLCATLDAFAEAARRAAERADGTALARLPRATLLRCQRWRETPAHKLWPLFTPLLHDAVEACLREPHLPELWGAFSTYMCALEFGAQKDCDAFRTLAVCSAVLALPLAAPLRGLQHLDDACGIVFLTLHSRLQRASDACGSAAEAGAVDAEALACVSALVRLAQAALPKASFLACASLAAVLGVRVARQALRRAGGLEALAATLPPECSDAGAAVWHAVAYTSETDARKHFVSTRAVASAAQRAQPALSGAPVLERTCLAALAYRSPHTPDTPLSDFVGIAVVDANAAMRVLMMALNGRFQLPCDSVVDDLLQRYGGGGELPPGVTAAEAAQRRAGAEMLFAFRAASRTADGAALLFRSATLVRDVTGLGAELRDAFLSVWSCALWAHLSDAEAVSVACAALAKLPCLKPRLDRGFIQLMLVAAQAHSVYASAAPLLVLAQAILQQKPGMRQRAAMETIASGGVRVAVALLRREWRSAPLQGDASVTTVVQARHNLLCGGPLRLLTVLSEQEEGRRELLDCAVPELLLRLYVDLPEDDATMRADITPFSPLRLLAVMLLDIQPDTTHADVRHLADNGFDAAALALLLRALRKAAQLRDKENLEHAARAICAACQPQLGRLALRAELVSAGAPAALAKAIAAAVSCSESAVEVMAFAMNSLLPASSAAAAGRNRRFGPAAAANKPQARSAAELAAAAAAADAAMAALLAEEAAEAKPKQQDGSSGAQRKKKNKKRSNNSGAAASAGGDASGASGSGASGSGSAVDAHAGAEEARAEQNEPPLAAKQPPPSALPHAEPAAATSAMPPPPPAVAVASPVQLPPPLPAPPPPPPVPAPPPTLPAPAHADASEMDALRAQLRQVQLDAAAAVATAAAAASALDAERESRLCVICLDAPKARLLAPCGHACVCGDCADALAARPGGGLCPVCRERITSASQRFYA
jgi:hypothetical protein